MKKVRTVHQLGRSFLRSALAGLILLALVAGPFTPARAQGPTATLQLIHNSPDPRFNTIDVYVDGTRIADDLGFRKATAFLNVPAARSFQLLVVRGDATSLANPILRSTVAPLETGEPYIGMAVGVGDPTNFAPNPEGRYTGFRVVVKRHAENMNPAKATVYFVHGVPDAPTIDVTVPGIGVLVDRLPYPAVSEFYELTPKRTQFNIVDAKAPATARFAYYFGELGGYAGQEVVVFASGFLKPASGAPGLGLYAAFDDGSVIALQRGGASAPLAAGKAGDGFGFDEAATPDRFSLRGAYPNPFNPTTTIGFDLPQASSVEVQVFNLLGQQVLAIPAQEMPAGANLGVRIDATNLPSGTYLYRITAANALETRVETGQIVLMK